MPARLCASRRARKLGYEPVPADSPEGERILPGTITEALTLTSSGAFEPLTEGSTTAVAQVRHHAGIARVLRYTFTTG
jgi:hypothetical protein